MVGWQLPCDCDPFSVTCDEWYLSILPFLTGHTSLLTPYTPYAGIISLLLPTTAIRTPIVNLPPIRAPQCLPLLRFRGWSQVIPSWNHPLRCVPSYETNNYLVSESNSFAL